MSSGVTGSFFRKGKILFHVAENGRSFDLDCDETTLVGEIMRRIESLSGISFDDQHVLYLDMKLESQRQFSAYKLPCDGGVGERCSFSIKQDFRKTHCLLQQSKLILPILRGLHHHPCLIIPTH
ncbi:hypothetical protein QN277_026473 [Acacia crassicarpa]|uniref:Ubiquitin-like domain-containing protein n=1 Tax=Acacia crassicarpa TaxID=499986 RepID=A0AAE1MKS0_9FABA|nr:hypothetical protein QN277_026473 [Acacia crassicarpa]